MKHGQNSFGHFIGWKMSPSWRRPYKYTKTSLQNLMKDLRSLNKPRYSLRQRCSSSVCLIRQSIWNNLYLVLADLLLGLLLLLLLLLLLDISRLNRWRFSNHTLIDSVGTLWKLSFFGLLRETSIPLLKKFVRRVVIVRI